MMKKDAYTEKISLWLDDELNPAEVTELKAHLETCLDCRQTYQAIQQVDELLWGAAAMMASPSPGFNQRVETRMVHYRPGQRWRIGVALAGLFLGTLLFAAAVAMVGGTALMGYGQVGVDADLFYQWLVSVIQSVTSLRVLLNLGGLFLKATFITMGQPLFWLCVLLSISMAWLWVRVMQTVSRRTAPTVEFVL
jgi:predicted anti-sigma-YlaC factor YlaD